MGCRGVLLHRIATWTSRSRWQRESAPARFGCASHDGAGCWGILPVPCRLLFLRSPACPPNSSRAQSSPLPDQARGCVAPSRHPQLPASPTATTTAPPYPLQQGVVQALDQVGVRDVAAQVLALLIGHVGQVCTLQQQQPPGAKERPGAKEATGQSQGSQAFCHRAQRPSSSPAAAQQQPSRGAALGPAFLALPHHASPEHLPWCRPAAPPGLQAPPRSRRTAPCAAPQPGLCRRQANVHLESDHPQPCGRAGHRRCRNSLNRVAALAGMLLAAAQRLNASHPRGTCSAPRPRPPRPLRPRPWPVAA